MKSLSHAIRSMITGSKPSLKQSAKKQRQRHLQFEPLEERQLLAVTPVPQNVWADVIAKYPDLGLKDRVISDYNYIEITDLTDQNLRDAISEAGNSNEHDLIVVRTTASQVPLKLSQQLAININASQRGSITIVSLGDKDLTLVAAENSRVFNINNNNANVALAGLTITGGNVSGSGGGIYSYGFVTITDCIITGNNASNYGGGIYQYSGTLNISDSFVMNNASEAAGAGIYQSSSSSTLTVLDSTFSGNKTSNDGGAIYAVGALTVTNSNFSKNEATSRDGGGIYIKSGSKKAELNGVIFENNSAYRSGGGMSVQNSSNVTINQTVFKDKNTTTLNESSSYGSGGGGLHIYAATVDVSHCSFYDNSSPWGGGMTIYSQSRVSVSNSTFDNNTATGSGGGGAVWIEGFGSGDTVTNITNVTITGNNASNDGGGIVVANNGRTPTLNLYNSIVAGNTDSSGYSDIWNYDDRQITLAGSHNLIGVAGNQTAFKNGENGNIVGTAKNPINPNFGDRKTLPNGVVYYTLRDDSPAIDHGDIDEYIAAVAAVKGIEIKDVDVTKEKDVAGRPRKVGLNIDMGAWESSINVQAAVFKYNLITPSVLGNSALGTFYIEWRNTGNIAGDAPMLILDATQNGKPGALLTLDAFRINNGYSIDTYPDGFSTSVAVIGSGANGGKVNPGETVRIPVYYVGWDKPWDTVNPYDFTLTVIESTNTEKMNLGEMKKNLKSSDISDSAWDTIWSNFTSLIGGNKTWGDYVKMLDGVAGYLAEVGQKTYDVNSLLQIALGWADDAYNPMAAPIVTTDAAVAGTGFLLNFTRSFYGTTFSSRDKQTGAMGYGWDNNWNWKLIDDPDGDGDKILVGPHGVRRTFQVDGRVTNAGWYVSSYGDQGMLKKEGSDYILTESSGTVLTFGSNGALKSIRDTNGNVVTATTDSSKRITKLETGGQSLTITYSGDKISQVADSFGYTTKYSYTGNQLTKVEYLANDVVVDTVVYTYNGTSGVLRNTIGSITYTDGAKTVYTYDSSSGRLVGGYSQDKDGKKSNTVAFKSGTSTSNMLVYSYTTEDKPYQTLFYNEKGQVLRSLETTASGKMTRTTYTYNDQGWLTRYEIEELKLVAWGEEANAPEKTVWYANLEYDTEGNVTKVTNSQGQNLEFTYDYKFGQVKSIKDTNGNITTFDYDAKGNPVKTTRADKTSSSLSFNTNGTVDTASNRRGQESKFTYYDSGLLHTVTTPDGKTTYEYDKWQNVTKITDSTGATSFSYSADGLYLERIDYPNGRYIKYTYDKTLGVKTSIDAGRKSGSSDQSDYFVAYTFNSFGLLEHVKDKSGKALESYQYDSAGLLVKEVHGNGTYTVYTYYDTLTVPKEYGILKSKIDYMEAKSDPLAKSEYTYNSSGLVSTLTSLDGTWTYEYDQSGQLAKAIFASTNTAKVPNQTLVYSYDALGNRISTTTNGVTVTYVTNSMNQYTDDGTYTYKYDKDGNMTEKREKSTGKAWAYTYDTSGKLTKQTDPDGKTYQFEYDALGNRCAMIVDGVRTDYLIDPSGLGNVLAEYNAAGSKTVDYVYGNGLVSMVHIDQEQGKSNPYYYGFDALGSTTILTDNYGAVKQEYVYDPFGNALVASDTVANPFQYVGQFGVQNNGTGQIYMRARSYDSKTGRFTTEDPIGLNAGDANLYRYCDNTPANGIDPSGKVNWLGLGGGFLSVVEGFSTVAFAGSVGTILGATTISATLGLGVLGVGVLALGAYGIYNIATGTAQMIDSYRDNPLNNNIADQVASFASESLLSMGFGRKITYGALVVNMVNTIRNQSQENIAYPSKTQNLINDSAKERLNNSLIHDQQLLTTYQELNEMAANLGMPGLFNDMISYHDARIQRTIPQINARDPNQIIGPSGSGTSNYIKVTSETVFPYTIKFQNNPRATAPAQQVHITLDLNDERFNDGEYLDPSTYEFTGFSFGSFYYQLTEEEIADFRKLKVFEKTVQTVAPLSKKAIDVSIKATIEGSSINFSFITTYTYKTEPISIVEALDGFLAPGNYGSVSYRVKPKSDLPNGTTIRSVAYVKFDAKGEEFATNLKDPNNPDSDRDMNREALVTISNAELGKPTNLAAIASSATSVKLTWQSGDTFGRDERVLIERFNPTKNEYEKVAETVNHGSYTDYYVTPETTYQYRITAINSKMNISSATVTFPSVTTPAKTVDAPTTPSGFKATPFSESIKLDWSLGGNSVDSYVLQYSTNKNDWTDINLGKVATYTHSGLTSNTTYYYRLLAVNSAGASTNAAEVSGTSTVLAPTMPTDLTVSVVDSTTLFVTWTAPELASEFHLEYSLDGTNWNSVTTQRIIDNYYLHTGLTPNTTYYYRVSGVNTTGTSTATAASNTKTPKETDTAPDSPTEFASPSQTSTSVTLNWTASTGATGYDIQYRKSGDTSWSTANVSISGAMVTISKLDTNSRYEFQVRAKNSAGESAWSDSVFVTTLPIDNPPTAPTNLSGTAKSSNEIGLTWTASTGATGYGIQYRVKGGSNTDWKTANITINVANTSAAISNLKAGTEYEFQVRATNSAGESNWSSSVFVKTNDDVTPPIAPENLKISTTNNSATLTWTLQGDLTGYKLEYKKSSESNWGTWSSAPGANATSATITGLTGGVLYNFRLTAINGVGTASSTQDAATQIVPPTNLNSSNQAPNSFTLTWTASTGATGYDIQYRESTGTSWSTEKVSISGTTAVVSGLKANTSYVFQVRAKNSTGESTWASLTASTKAAAPIIALAADAGPLSKPIVQVYDAVTEELLFEITADRTFGVDYTGGVRVATGDLDGDGVPDIVVVPGRSMAPTVLVFSGVDGSLLENYCIPATATYGMSFKDGLNVAVGDVVGSGMNDIILIPSGGQAVVKVFENITDTTAGTSGFANRAARQFNAFEDYKQFIGGGSIAVGNTETAVTSGDKSQIVIGTGAGIEPMVRVFDVVSDQTAYKAIREVKSIRADAVGGVNVAIGDLNGDGYNELIVASKNGGRSWVDLYKFYPEKTPRHVAGFQAFGPTEGNNVAVNLVARDTDGDGLAEIIVTQGAKGKAGFVARKFQVNSLETEIVDEIFAEWSNPLATGLFIG